MRTSCADCNNGKCPKCDDETTNDKKGRGFVRHKTNRDCHYGKGEKDIVPKRKPSK